MGKTVLMNQHAAPRRRTQWRSQVAELKQMVKRTTVAPNCSGAFLERE
jgi:hypothetical protein